MYRRDKTLIPLLMLLSACAVPQRLPPTHEPFNATSLNLKGTQVAVVSDTWWRLYENDALNTLAEQVLKQNPTLEQAQARVHAARALVGLEKGGLLPSVNAEADATRTRFSEYYIYPPPYGGGVYWNSNATLGANWSPDLFGLTHKRLAAAESEAIATEYRYRSAKTLLMAGLVAQAFEVDYNRQALKLAQESAALLRQKRTLEQQRVAAGLDSTTPLIALDYAVKDWEERIHGLTLQQRQLRSALAITAGTNPAQAPEYQFDITDRLLAQLPPDLPLDLLVRRADVKASLAMIESKRWQQLAAQAAFYPSINLTAYAGYQSLDIHNFITAPARTLGFGPSVSLPLLDGGRLNNAARISNAELDATIAAYNGVVLNAIRDVTDGIQAVTTLTNTLELKTSQHRDMVKLLEQTQRRVDRGLQNQLALVDAKLAERHAEWERLTLVTQLAQKKVDLLVALGGPPEPVLSSHPEVVP